MAITAASLIEDNMKTLPRFEDSTFKERPDLSPYLIHLTRKAGRRSAFENLLRIMQEGRLCGGTKFIKEGYAASCFMDVPFAALKSILNNEVNCNTERPRYEPYGIFIRKEDAYAKGCRPVLYLGDNELFELDIPQEELWRVVRFEFDSARQRWINWLHEREWRCKGDFWLTGCQFGVLVRDPVEEQTLWKKICENSRQFKATPGTIVSVSVVMQGLKSKQGTLGFR